MPGSPRDILKRVLPEPFRHSLRETWENIRDWVDTFLFALHFITSRMSRPRLLLYFGFAPGDDLLCTTVLRELHLRGRDGLLMISNHNELFSGNTDAAVQPLWRRYYADGSTVRICRRFTQLFGGEFKRLEYAPPSALDRRRSPQCHVIAEMCVRAGIAGAVAIRPYMTLTEQEKSAAAWAKGCIVIQSSGASARFPARNKEWYPDRFQAVVKAFGTVSFVQLGSTHDPLLEDVTDLRGKTSIRAAAAVLHQARLYVGLEGFLMHLARAVECPGVIVFGGRVAPWQIGYACNTNLYSAIPCAPCWRTNTCDFDRQCMRNISAADVVSAVRRMITEPRGPLPVEIVDIVPNGASEQREVLG